MKVEDLEEGDTIEVSELDGEWVVDTTGIDELTLFEIPYAAIVNGDEWRSLIGNCTAPEPHPDETKRKTIEIRDEDDNVVTHIAPCNITKV